MLGIKENDWDSYFEKLRKRVGNTPFNPLMVERLDRQVELYDGVPELNLATITTNNKSNNKRAPLRNTE